MCSIATRSSILPALACSLSRHVLRSVSASAALRASRPSARRRIRRFGRMIPAARALGRPRTSAPLSWPPQLVHAVQRGQVIPTITGPPPCPAPPAPASASASSRAAPAARAPARPGASRGGRAPRSAAGSYPLPLLRRHLDPELAVVAHPVLEDPDVQAGQPAQRLLKDHQRLRLRQVRHALGE